MATDPNAILQTMMPTAIPAAPAPQPVAANPFVPGGTRPAMHQMAPGGFHGLLQAAQSADPNAWSQFTANPWATHLQQRFGVTPEILQGLQSTLAGMGTPHDIRQYFRSNYGHPGGGGGGGQPGMVPGVPGSVATNPAAGVPGNTGIVPPSVPAQPAPAPMPPTAAPPAANPMLPPNMTPGGWSSLTHLSHNGQPVSRPGFGL